MRRFGRAFASGLAVAGMIYSSLHIIQQYLGIPLTWYTAGIAGSLSGLTCWVARDFK